MPKQCGVFEELISQRPVYQSLITLRNPVESCAALSKRQRGAPDIARYKIKLQTCDAVLALQTVAVDRWPFRCSPVSMPSPEII
jgi:hypothetical protein